MPALFKIFIVICLMILLIARKVNLGLTLILGAGLLGLVAPLAPLKLAALMGKVAVKPQTLHLLAAIYLVLLLGLVMKHTHCFEKTVSALGQLFQDKRISLAAVPSLIGLLPVLGGAMLSAPMIGEIGDELEMSPEAKTFVNYWFRHVWEYVWPLYPGVILTAALLNISVFQLALHQLPLTLAAVAGGITLGLRRVKNIRRTGASERNDTRHSLTLLLQGVSPILLVIVFIFIVRLDVVMALLITLGGMAVVFRLPWVELAHLAKTAFSLNTILVVLGVMAFRDVFELTGLAISLPGSLAGLGVPPAVVIFALPFLVGFMTGVTQAFVAITFPLLMVWINPGSVDFPAVMLAYAGGFTGVLFSPVHFCLVLTREFFHADLKKVYGLLASPVGLVVFVAFVAFFIF